MYSKTYLEQLFCSGKPYVIIEKETDKIMHLDPRLLCLVDSLKMNKIEYKSVLYKCAEVILICSDKTYKIITIKDNIKLINGDTLIATLEPLSDTDFYEKYVI